MLMTHALDRLSFSGHMHACVRVLISDDPWCYVNRSECALPSSQAGSSRSFRLVDLAPTSRAELHYSYSACGVPCDAFTAASRIELHSWEQTFAITSAVGTHGSQSHSAFRTVSPLPVCTLLTERVCTACGVQVGTAGLIALVAFVVYLLWRRRQRQEDAYRSRLRYRLTRQPAKVAPLADGLRYHLFLSHVIHGSHTHTVHAHSHSHLCVSALFSPHVCGVCTLLCVVPAATCGSSGRTVCACSRTG